MPPTITAMIGGITVWSFKGLVDSLCPSAGCRLGNIGSFNNLEAPAFYSLFQIIPEGAGQAVMILRADTGGQMDYNIFFLFFIGQQPFFQIFDFYIDPRSAAAAAVHDHVTCSFRISFHFPAALGKCFHAIIAGAAPGHQFALYDYH